MGVNAGVFGALVGLGFLFIAILVLGVFRVSGAAMFVMLIAIMGVNVVLGLWPSWMIVIMAVIGGVLLWREISGSGSEA